MAVTVQSEVDERSESASGGGQAPALHIAALAPDPGGANERVEDAPLLGVPGAAAVLAAVCTSVLALATATSEASPRIEVLTMGPGDDVFSKFGHAAICVDNRCFNYGTADFSTPLPLSYDFLRGRAEFWVSVTLREQLLSSYEQQDRTLYSQALPLSDEQALELAARLYGDARPENRFYTYHHFADNCTTRVRDHIDTVTHGRLAAGADALYPQPLRALVREGFSTHIALAIVGELALARTVDRRPTLWQAMFLPRILREQIQARLGAEPQLLYRRRAPLGRGNVNIGRDVLLAAAAAWALLLALGLRFGGRVGARVVLGLAGLILGTVGVLLDALAATSVHADLRHNEALLLFLPLDWLLALLGERWLRRYATVRLLWVTALAALAAAGVLIEPLWPALVFVGVTMLIVAGLYRPARVESTTWPIAATGNVWGPPPRDV